MKTKPLLCLAATAMAAAIVSATPAIARGGFGGGGMHFGGGGMHFGGPMVMGRSISVPSGNRFVHAPFAGRHVFGNRFNDRFNDRFEDRFEHRHRFRNFAFFGVPFAYDYAAYGNGCWRRVWTPYGWRGSNICYDYGY